MKKVSSILEKFKVINLKSREKFVLIGLVGLLIIAGGSAIYLVNKNNRLTAANIPLTAEQSQKIISEIGKLIDLPSGETPILATVTDVALLPKEPFYEKAQNGDRVLVYKSSKMAVIYRPGANKIIKVGTVKIEESGPSSTPSGAVAGVSDNSTQEEKALSVTPTPALVRIAIYNGTKIPGFAKKTSDRLEAKFQNIEIVATSNTSKDYSKTLVVDLSGKNKSASQSLAKELNGEVGELPDGETAPSADILIIVASE